MAIRVYTAFICLCGSDQPFTRTLHAELVRAVHKPSPPGSSDGARWVLHDVIGLEDGLGVECLSGSGAIASAYNRVFRWARVVHELVSCACEHQLVAWGWRACVVWV
jgi:hypothetical protein